jgi:CRISPR-associated protein Csd1
VDKSEYSLGKDPAATRPPETLVIRAQLFRNWIRKCFDETHDAPVGAVVQFLDDLAAGKQAVDLPPECQANDQFAFKVGSDRNFVHLRPAVKAYWKGLRQEDDTGEGDFHCLVTGQSFSAPGLFPLIKKVPGGTTSGVALVSFNTNAFESYGLQSNENAPVCRDAAEACATALNRLLHPAFPDPQAPGQTLLPRHFRLSDDTAVVFWSSAKTAGEFLNNINGIMAADRADLVAEQFRSIWTGKASNLDDPSSFYAMTLTGVQGRVVIRDWLETTVADAGHNLQRYFGDLRIVRQTQPAKGTELPPALPMRALLDSLIPPGRNESVPGTLAAELVHSALTGQPYPASLLQRVLVRARAEAGRDEWIDAVRSDARAALLKAVFNRTYRSKIQTEVTETMDPNNPNRGYRLGRMMAVLENMQRLALGKNVNATVVDKYFGGASATPAAVFHSLLNMFRKHARKARDEYPGIVINLEREADDILNGLDTIPLHLDIAEQGMFVLGYHHERCHLRPKKKIEDTDNE